jgi:hypothetical protein
MDGMALTNLTDDLKGSGLDAEGTEIYRIDLSVGDQVADTGVDRFAMAARCWADGAASHDGESR